MSHINAQRDAKGDITLTLRLSDTDVLHIQDGGGIWFRDFKMSDGNRITFVVQSEKGITC
ncbi:MAG TPA: hypothetical protein VMO76_14835 [Candidatus Udaeobacter sp.]|nr:hypothetical protein [Candidatus Udaeobacter sp.]